MTDDSKQDRDAKSGESLCHSVLEHMTDILDGTADDVLFDHLAECDTCRDARHDAERMATVVADAAADYEPPADLESRVLAAIGGGEEATEPAPEVAETPAAESDATQDEAPEPAPQKDTLPSTPPRTVPMSDSGTARANTEDVPERSHRVARTAPEQSAAKPAKPVGGGLTDRPTTVRRLDKRRLVLLGGGGAALAAAAALVLVLRGGGGVTGGDDADGAWKGKVEGIASARTGAGGLQVCDPEGNSCKPAGADGAVPAGSVLKTDAATRAQVALGDGSVVSLDRNTRLSLSAERGRSARLESGAIVADIAKVEGSEARFDVPDGHVAVLGTKLALSVVDGATTVDVSRGAVKLADQQDRAVTVRAGEEGRLYRGTPPFVSAAPALGEAMAWSEAAAAEGDGEEVQSRGLGELKAQKPGEKTERAGAVTLTAHSVKVRIAGAMARTEIDETFQNHSDDVLEGIYRFPIPPDAKIERLALEVDGKLEEGAFVDRERAAAIWRGAIVNAAPQIRREIRDEIVWVPGPWKDPALLEWQRGGRFELRIYPIPKRGSRRVVLAYTQVIKPTGGVRRFSYPLAHDPSGSTKVERFDVDIQVRGHDEAFGVRSRGYELAKSQRDGADTLNMKETNFVPAGDLTVEYALPNRDAELTAWAYRPTAAEQTKAAKSPEAKPAEPTEAALSDDAPYVAIALRPKLPRARENVKRRFALIVDSSRSMFGESYRRAVAVAEKTIREMDRGDTFTLLACDVECRALPGGALGPSAQTALEARRFLEGITPEGASDVTLSVQEARKAASGGEGDLRIVLIGDGTPTVGPIRPAYVTRAVQDALPPGSGTVTAVAVGADSDLDTLAAVARGGGGVVLPFVPGQTTAEAAFAVLGATYGTTLRDVTVELPSGLVEVAPKRLDTIVAGSEELVVARMDKSNLDGTVVLRGKLGKETFEQRYPLRLAATESKGNAFVPRLFAATRIADLEREPSASAKKEAVRLSSLFDVASRYTSLLVLESAAMFRAFGLDNTRTHHQWTGEEVADLAATAEGTLDVGEGEADALDGLTGAGKGGGGRADPQNPFDSPGFGSGSSVSGGAFQSAPAAPTAAPAPAKAAAKPKPAEEPLPFAAEAKKESKAKGPLALGDDAFEQRSSRRPPSWRPPPRRRMIPMRRIWERKGTIDVGRLTPSAATPSTIAIAERELEQNPNRRDGVKKLYTLLALAGDVERAFSTAERWSEKEPLDPEALTARADLAARSGDRELAIRILGSVVDVRPDDVASQQRLARLHRWAGRPELGCRHTLAIAQIRSGDSRLLAEAVSCARQTGESRMGDDMLLASEEKLRRVAERQISIFDKRSDELSGDLRLEASWSGGADVDLAILHPDGHRVSWLGAPTRSVITATDVTSTSREGLALRGAKPGEYVIEVVRASGAGPIRGEVTLVVAGTRRSVPFTLDGNRETVALAKIAMQSRLVPVNSWQGF